MLFILYYNPLSLVQLERLDAHSLLIENLSPAPASIALSFADNL